MRKLTFSVCLFFVVVTTNTSLAKSIKLAALAPEGTTWASQLKSMAKEIKSATKGRVKFKLYLGGVAGDEPDVLRKIRVGQLHGAIFTGKTLGDIFSDSRMLEVPFNFQGDRTKATKAIKGLQLYLQKGFSEQGFKNLGTFELGRVYFVSKNKAANLQALKGMKIWSWDGDPVVAAMVDTLDLVTVPLALPDVMNSLSTGIVEAAYATPLGIVALQWQNKVKYMVDLPLSYGIAALLVSHKIWNQIKKEDQHQIETIVAAYVEKTNEATIIENQQALMALKSSGLEMVSFSKSEVDKSQVIRENIIKKLQGKVLSAKVISLFQQKMRM